jgi:histidyl-tRNA synthetase
MLESTNLYRRSIGNSTDIVSKEMFSFQDINEDNVSLRPEATAGIMRAIKENSLLGKSPILKLYTIGPMFRRERPSKERYRQFWQINAELVGDISAYGDADTIITAARILKSLGIEATLEINSVGCKNCRSVYEADLKSYLVSVQEFLCDDCQRRLVVKPMRTLDCKETRCKALLESAPRILDFLDTPCKLRFEEIQELLTLVDVPFRINPDIVRGLDYYSGIAFEFTTETLGRSKAIGGGGRYEDLLSSIGGPNSPGIGFAFGVERLVASLNEFIPNEKSVFIAALGTNAEIKAFELLQNLRSRGIPAEARLSGSLKSQMKIANKVGARFVIIIGSNELVSGNYTIRDMEKSSQEEISADRVGDFLNDYVK